MSYRYSEFLPDVETAMEISPEDLGLPLLKLLNEDESNTHNMFNLANVNGGNFKDWSGEDRQKKKEAAEKILVAFQWLINELLLVPDPEQSGNFYLITSEGMKVLEQDDFNKYHLEHFFPKNIFEPILVKKVRHLFLRGDYDTAIFQAFKEVEVLTREKFNIDKKIVGVDLMHQAFKDKNFEKSDEDPAISEARRKLFSGAIGYYRNPCAHHNEVFTDPKEIISILGIANQLLQILDNIDKKMLTKIKASK